MVGSRTINALSGIVVNTLVWLALNTPADSSCDTVIIVAGYTMPLSHAVL